MRKLKTLFLLSTLFAVSACSNHKSAPLVVPHPERRVEVVGGPEGADLKPAKAEIVFVIDNSASMEDHIKNVSNNIDAFVNSFAEKSNLEFNIAVTTVYDSRTFNKAEFQQKFAGTAAIRPNGQFLPLGGLQAMQAAIEDPSQRSQLSYFLKHTDPNLKAKLKELLKVGVQSLATGGPEVEEVLSPLQAIYLDAKSNVKPQGFAQSKDSYKIFFFVTDASDNSKFDVDQFYVELLASAANGQPEKLMAFGAIVPTGEKSCKPDPGVKTNRLENFLHLTQPIMATPGSNIVSLCKSFGRKFAEFGDMIRQQTSQYKIQLIHAPDGTDPDSEDEDIGIFVTYGNQRLLAKDKAYTYDPGSKRIIIDPAAIKQYSPGARFRVVYTPITEYDRRANLVASDSAK